MKRLAVLIMALILCLAACGGPEDKGEGAAQVDSATTFKEGGKEHFAINQGINAFNSADRRSTTVRVNIKDKEQSLFFIDGSYSYTRATPIGMSGKTTQVIRGQGDTMDVYYKAGAYYRSSELGKYYSSMDKALFLDEYLCRQLPTCTIKHSAKGSTAHTLNGTKYTVDFLDKDFCGSVFGESLSLYSGVRLVAEDKTTYKNGKAVYVIDENGALKSFVFTCTVSLVDTAPYYPTGYTPTVEELTTTLELSYELLVRATGHSVEIQVPKTEEYTFLG